MDMDTLTPILEQAASSALSSFPVHHDRDDCRQAAWLWAYENRRAVEQAMQVDGWEGVVFNQIRRAVNAHLRKEDAESYGYALDDHFLYSEEVIRLLLWDVWNVDNWQGATPLGDGLDADRRKATSLANTTGDRVAMLIDVKHALTQLSDDQYSALRCVYRDMMSLEVAAQALGCTEEAVKGRLRRGVGAIRKALGTKPLSELRAGPVGRRRAVSSAEARARMEADF